MRELIFTVVATVIAGIVQTALAGLWGYLTCTAHIFCF